MPNHDRLTGSELEEWWITMSLKRYEEGRYGLQALINKSDGELLGICGLLAQDVSDRDELEVGYHLFCKHWGKGFASEAAQLFRDYGFETTGAESIVSIIHPLNFLSKKVAARNGTKLAEKSGTFRGKEVDVFRITRDEWLQLKSNTKSDTPKV